MTDTDFRQLCNTFGFAPSRALRELIDCATARAEAQRDALLEALKLSRAQWIHSVNSDHCLAAIKAVRGEEV